MWYSKKKEPERPGRLLVYCRESRDENGENRERIETQRDMLLTYAREKDLGQVVKIVMDDDVTGTDFRRLDAVREMAERGEIDAVLLKDSSRLGRNLTESLLFTEFLGKCGVDLLFESEEYNEDFFPLEAWFHEQRAKEDSRKIRRVLYHKMAEGDLLISPPYGYARDGKRLVPGEAAATVKEIFRLFLSGESPGEIARRLDREGIPTPSRDKGRKNASLCWSGATVRRILSDEVYTGRRTYRKTVGKSFKDKRRLSTAPGERIVREEDHPPLIDGKDFEAARGKLQKLTRGSSGKTPFAGLLFCGGCQSRMVLRKKKGREEIFVCSRFNKGGRRLCAMHGIPRAAVEAAVRGAARGLAASEPEKKAKNGPAESGALLEALYEDYIAGRIAPAFFEKARAKLAPDPAAPAGGDFDPRRKEEELAPLLIARMTLYEKGEGGFDRKTLLVRTRV
ncbi:MAG: recombinase family protein [Clostridia bacterium]|nr:recombinase family protein [Clostridia bacterium]